MKLAMVIGCMTLSLSAFADMPCKVLREYSTFNSNGATNSYSVQCKAVFNKILYVEDIDATKVDCGQKINVSISKCPLNSDIVLKAGTLLWTAEVPEGFHLSRELVDTIGTVE